MKGLPSSWDTAAATSYSKANPYKTLWSPCNRVIAIISYKSVVILDAATLSQLDTFTIASQYLNNEAWQPSFSPDSHCLTLIGRRVLISWDLQTGGLLGAIPSGLEIEAYKHLSVFSSTYSEDGKVVAAAYLAWDRTCSTEQKTFIRTYNLSGTEVGPHCAIKGQIIKPIWTHGKCIRFITISHGSVAVLEVEFTLKNPPVEVESLPIADKIIEGKSFLFLPSCSLLAFILRDTIQVWDAKAAKQLRKSKFPCQISSQDTPIFSFSSDGSFFAHSDLDGVAWVFKKSPTGYNLHQKLPIGPAEPLHKQLHLSPSGKSIFISSTNNVFHLWHTRDRVSSLPSVSVRNENSCTLAFSPNEKLAAFAQRGKNMVTIFDPLASDLQLAIKINMGVVCLGITRNTLIIVGEKNVIRWKLPGGDRFFNANIQNNSVWTTFENGIEKTVRTITLYSNQVQTSELHRIPETPICGSISPDFSHIAILSGRDFNRTLEIFEVSSTERHIKRTQARDALWVGFTQDGHEVWTINNRSDKKLGWRIIKGSGSDCTRLERRDGVACLSEPFPWDSRCGYKLTGDGWVLSATQKRLLWLPHHWRSNVGQWVWGGRFLGLLQSELSDMIILEFPE